MTVASVTLRCPECESPNVGSADVVLCTALGEWVVQGDGKIEFDPEGWTEVHWDSQTVRDEAQPCVCVHCGWQGSPGEMRRPS